MKIQENLLILACRESPDEGPEEKEKNKKFVISIINMKPSVISPRHALHVGVKNLPIIGAHLAARATTKSPRQSLQQPLSISAPVVSPSVSPINSNNSSPVKQGVKSPGGSEDGSGISPTKPIRNSGSSPNPKRPAFFLSSDDAQIPVVQLSPRGSDKREGTEKVNGDVGTAVTDALLLGPTKLRTKAKGHVRSTSAIPKITAHDDNDVPIPIPTSLTMVDSISISPETVSEPSRRSSNSKTSSSRDKSKKIVTASAKRPSTTPSLAASSDLQQRSHHRSHSSIPSSPSPSPYSTPSSAPSSNHRHHSRVPSSQNGLPTSSAPTSREKPRKEKYRDSDGGGYDKERRQRRRDRLSDSDSDEDYFGGFASRKKVDRSKTTVSSTVEQRKKAAEAAAQLLGGRAANTQQIKKF